MQIYPLSTTWKVTTNVDVMFSASPFCLPDCQKFLHSPIFASIEFASSSTPTPDVRNKAEPKQVVSDDIRFGGQSERGAKRNTGLLCHLLWVFLGGGFTHKWEWNNKSWENYLDFKQRRTSVIFSTCAWHFLGVFSFKFCDSFFNVNESFFLMKCWTKVPSYSAILCVSKSCSYQFHFTWIKVVTD